MGPAEYEISKQHLKTLPVRMTRNDVVRVIQLEVRGPHA